MSTWAQEIAPAKLNLALHVRGKLSDGRHAIETIFAFCTDGDRLKGRSAQKLTLEVTGPFSKDLAEPCENLVTKAAQALAIEAGVDCGAHLILDKQLPVASGIGGGSADAAAALRLLTSLWRVDPAHALRVAPTLGSDVPACLLSCSMRGTGAGDELSSVTFAGLSQTPVLLVNPGLPLSTREVFSCWNGNDGGPLTDWRQGTNDLETAAIMLVPQISDVLAWLRQREGSTFARMSGSGATCFALFETVEARDLAAAAVPLEWWHLRTFLR